MGQKIKPRQNRTPRNRNNETKDMFSSKAEGRSRRDRRPNNKRPWSSNWTETF